MLRLFTGFFQPSITLALPASSPADHSQISNPSAPAASPADDTQLAPTGGVRTKAPPQARRRRKRGRKKRQQHKFQDPDRPKKLMAEYDLLAKKFPNKQDGQLWRLAKEAVNSSASAKASRTSDKSEKRSCPEPETYLENPDGSSSDEASFFSLENADLSLDGKPQTISSSTQTASPSTHRSRQFAPTGGSAVVEAGALLKAEGCKSEVDETRALFHSASVRPYVDLTTPSPADSMIDGTPSRVLRPRKRVKYEN